MAARQRRAAVGVGACGLGTRRGRSPQITSVLRDQCLRRRKVARAAQGPSEGADARREAAAGNDLGLRRRRTHGVPIESTFLFGARQAAAWYVVGGQGFVLVRRHPPTARICQRTTLL